MYQPVTVVTPQGQVVTQALSPGTIRIQNSQVRVLFLGAGVSTGVGGREWGRWGHRRARLKPEDGCRTPAHVGAVPTSARRQPCLRSPLRFPYCEKVAKFRKPGEVGERSCVTPSPEPPQCPR